MRTTLFVLVSGFALSMSGAALADTANTSAAAAAAPEPMAQSTAIPQATPTESQGARSGQPISAVGDEHKVICHHLVHGGTILPQQECRTKHTWELIRLQEQNKFRDVQMQDDQP